HPDAVRAFIRAFVAAERGIIDAPERIRDLSTRLAMDADAAQSLAEAYRARRIWHTNGGLTPAKIGASLDFLAAAHAVPDGLTPEQVADLSHLTAVLNDIGRR